VCKVVGSCSGWSSSCELPVVVDGGQCYLWDVAHPFPSICRGKAAPGGDKRFKELFCLLFLS
jgi:hypothetical protein